MTRLITKLFGPPEEIHAWNPCTTRFHRWTIFGSHGFKVYLHHSFGEDCSRDLHTYSKRFISVGFVRSYEYDSGEELPAFPDQAAWMVLIAKSAPNKNYNSPCA